MGKFETIISSINEWQYSTLIKEIKNKKAMKTVNILNDANSSPLFVLIFLKWWAVLGGSELHVV